LPTPDLSLKLKRDFHKNFAKNTISCIFINDVCFYFAKAEAKLSKAGSELAAKIVPKPSTFGQCSGVCGEGRLLQKSYRELS